MIDAERMPRPSDPTKSAKGGGERAARQARLAEALRRNLRERKRQKQARHPPASKDLASPEPPDPDTTPRR